MPPRLSYVVDASVIVKWLNQNREPFTKQAADLLHHAANFTLTLITSDLAVHEVLNALIKGKGLTGRTLEQGVEAFFELPLVFADTNPNIAAAAAILATDQHITFYDAIYMALAFDRDIPLVTANPRHQKSVGGLTVIPIQLLEL